ncbi:MAG: DNA-protecting protein DprA [Candidatus Methylomirabilis oxygeniifera]|uniref:DNA processing chain A (DprA/Smf) n=1 Tax=Methylomirabilis oxygeniifera TaxID=671143 RepID=D5MHP7_METO1|nr:MAG: DNA-protecting protein DprA [Candidatus Methylomirabilis oxyfera]CBE67180.1 DNA processing chain A (DprA/Smf) [Candidatus Methylomirabilis oxyfera]
MTSTDRCLAEQDAWLALALIPEVGSATFYRLREALGSVEAVLRANKEALAQVPGISRQVAQAIASFPWRDTLDRELRVIETRGLGLRRFGEEGYPELLAAIHSPPPVLYLRGTMRSEDRTAVAIVGSRTASPYGAEIAERISGELAQRGVTIVSGMARGIDAAAHRGALRVGGRTLAVLGCGLGVTYPPEHAELADQIAVQGAVISEFSIFTPPKPSHFPRRNRIISGLARGVVVIEAGLDSGALITANYALEQGRDVFAVPGQVTSRLSRGCHQLIKAGAKLTEGWEDIWEDVELQVAPSAQTMLDLTAARSPLEPQEVLIIDTLEAGPMQIDDLIARTQLPAGQMASLLLSLMLKGLIEELPGKSFAKRIRPTKGRV